MCACNLLHFGRLLNVQLDSGSLNAPPSPPSLLLFPLNKDTDANVREAFSFSPGPSWKSLHLIPESAQIICRTIPGCNYRSHFVVLETAYQITAFCAQTLIFLHDNTHFTLINRDDIEGNFKWWIFRPTDSSCQYLLIWIWAFLWEKSP